MCLTMHIDKRLMGTGNAPLSKSWSASRWTQRICPTGKQRKNHTWNFKLLPRLHEAKCNQTSNVSKSRNMPTLERQHPTTGAAAAAKLIELPLSCCTRPKTPSRSTRPGSLRERPTHLHTSSPYQSQQAGHRFWAGNFGCMVGTECAPALISTRPGHGADDGAAAAWAF